MLLNINELKFSKYYLLHIVASRYIEDESNILNFDILGLLLIHQGIREYV